MLAQINLLPRKDLAGTRIEKLLQFAISYGRYIIVVTQLIVLLVFFSRFRLDIELTDLKDSIEQKRDIVQSLQDFETEVCSLQDRIASARFLKENHTELKLALNSIKTILIPGNVLTSLSVAGNQIVISGMSKDGQSLSSFFNKINSTNDFSGFQIKKITKQQTSDFVDFQISLTLKGGRS